jgi:hypothetical protein
MKRDEVASTSRAVLAGARSTDRAVLAGARAHWRAKYPQASEDELDEIMAGPDRAAVRRYLDSLPQAIWEQLRLAILAELTDKVLNELVAEGRVVVIERGDNNELLCVRPTKGTAGALDRLVARRVAKKIRDQDAQWRREGAYEEDGPH